MSGDNRLVIDSFMQRFGAQKAMVEKAVAQLSDAQLRQPLDENTNSAAVIMKHMAGNLRSRFTDFLTSDGEKPGRDRDSEFIDDFPDRAALRAYWEQGWGCLIEALTPLTDADLVKTVTIRGQRLAVIEALVRALDHQGYHAGQIVQLARYLAKDHWTTLTIPRGGSRQFNEAMRQQLDK
jgi:uncharacterized damage-inducible protein DinB